MASKFLKGLTIKIGGDTSDLYKSLNKVDDQTNKLSQELGQINKLLNLDPTNTELLAQKQKVLADAISSTKDKLATLREAEKQVQEQFERGEVSEEQYRALQREIIATEQQLSKYEKAAKETAETEERLADGSYDASKGMEKAGNSSETAAAKFDSAAVAAAAALAAVVSLGKESVEAFNEVDAGADNVIRATGATGAAAGNLVESYKKVATQVVGSLDEIGATVGEVNTRFGYTGKLLEDCSTDFMKFAEITGVNSTNAVKMVTRALNDAGLPLSDYKILLDQLAKAGQSAGIDVTVLADGLSKNGATMRAMGFDTAETISLLAQFELSGADATTMLSGMKKAMGTWAKSGKDGRVEFAKLVEGVKDGSVSSAKALEVFGTRAGPQLVDAIKSGKFEYNQMLKVLEGSQGTLEDTFGELEDGGYSVQRSFQALKVKAGDLGEEIMEATAPALEELLNYLTEEDVVKKFGNTIKNDIVPGLKNVSGWVKSNGPTIKATIAGVTAALVASKVAAVADTVAHVGLKGAIAATTIAQEALALAQAATPWGLVSGAIVGVTTAMLVLSATTRDAGQPVNVLTEEEKALAAAADDAARAFRDQQDATAKNMDGINTQMDRVAALSAELQALADANGKVRDSDKARVDFILGELNEALGTEYKRTGDLIKNYKDLKANIDKAIESKRANLLLEAAEADYTTAWQNKSAAYDNMMLKQREYDAQQAQLIEKEKTYADEIEQLELQIQGAREAGNAFADAIYSVRLGRIQQELADERDAVEGKKTAWNDAMTAYSTYSNQIINWEEAQTAALAGNYDEAVDILGRKADSFGNYSDAVDTETARALDALQFEAIDAGRKAELMKKKFEEGTEGFTQEMIDEAETGYDSAMDAFSNAYADAEGVGEDLGAGLSGGMENKRSSLLAKAKSLVEGIIAAMRKAADSHSPSRKTIAFGEDVGEGPVIGIQRKTKDAKKAATEQVAAIMDAYKAPDVAVQHTFRNISELQVDRYVGSQMTAATANSAVLEQILAAIKAGQVLILDSNVVAGGTAGKVNNILGANCILTERGAL